MSDDDDDDGHDTGHTKMNWWEIPVPDLDDAKIGGDMGWWAAFTEPAGRWIGFSTSDPAGA